MLRRCDTCDWLQFREVWRRLTVQAVEHRDAGCTRLAQEQPANAARYAGVANRDKRRSNLTTRAAAFSTRCSMLVVAFGAPARTALQ